MVPAHRLIADGSVGAWPAYGARGHGVHVEPAPPAAN